MDLAKKTTGIYHPPTLRRLPVDDPLILASGLDMAHPQRTAAERSDEAEVPAR